MPFNMLAAFLAISSGHPYIWQDVQTAHSQPAPDKHLVIPVSFYHITCINEPVLHRLDDGWHRVIVSPGKGGTIDGVPNGERCDMAACSLSPYLFIPLWQLEKTGEHQWQSQPLDGIVSINQPAYWDSACTLARPLRFVLDTRSLPRSPQSPDEYYRP